MADEIFDTNILRWIAAELYFSAAMQCSREMFGKSYFSLGNSEKIAVDNAVAGFVRGNYQGMTPEFLNQSPVPEASKSQTAKPSVGFQTPVPKT